MSNKSSHTFRKPIRLDPTAKGPPVDFWSTKTLEELAAEQGVRAIEHLEEVLGKGSDLWRDDREVEAFLTDLRERRQKGA